MNSFLLSIILMLVSVYSIAQCEFPSDNSGNSCENAIALCSVDLINLNGSLSAVPNTNAPSPLCPNDGEADNIKWYKFFACEENIELQITPENCTLVDCDSIQVSGMQAGLYRDCNFDEIIACSVDGNTSAFTLTGGGLVPGELVFLFLDGYKGSVCDYQINAISGIDTTFIDFESDSLDMPMNGMVTGESKGCVDGMAMYGFTPATCVGSGRSPSCTASNLFEQNLLCYEWIIEPSEGWEFVGDSTAAVVEINWLEADTFEISVIEHRDPILGACGSGLLVCGEVLPLSVAIIPPIVEVLPPVVLCEGDQFSFCGEVITTSTTVTCEVDTCLFEVQEVIFIEPIFNYIGNQVICSSSSCYNIYGVDYCEEGSYSVLNPTSQCQEITEFTLIDFDDSRLALASSNDINCLDRSSSLSAELVFQGYSGQIDYTWTDGSGNVLSNSNEMIVGAGGSYNCIATIPGVDCEVPASIFVDENTLEVSATFSHDTINCKRTETTINYTANQNITSHHWSNRTGFDSQLPNPKVIEGGLYFVTLTASNGCQLTEEFTVIENKEVPVGTFLPTDDWQCDTEQMELLLSIADNEVIVDWQTVDGSIIDSNNERAVISKPGEYSATLYNPESHCSSTISSIIENAADMLQDFEFEKSDIYCYSADDGQITLTNILGGELPLTLYVDNQPQGGAQELEALVPGRYEIELVDNNGCTVSKEIEIIEFPEVEINIPLEIEVIYDTPELLEVQLSEDRTITEVEWTNQDGGIIGSDSFLTVSVSEDSHLKVAVTDNHGCIIEEEVRLIVILANKIYIPNIFSPDGDGQNDFFTAFSIKSPGLIESLQIYDRWGNIIYTETAFGLGDEGSGWDGTYNGHQMLPGVYIYSATINNGADDLETIYGNVTLIRN